VGLNPTYFSTLFKKEMGVTFSNYILNVKIDHAKRLLKNTNMSLISIAIELGFDNQSYFSNVFKKATNMTPKQYRQAL
jgi:AraC-like DNA-binding protein